VARQEFETDPVNRVLELSVLATLILVPLFINVYGAMPFEESKAPLLRILALTALPFYIWAILHRDRRPANPEPIGRSPIIVPALAVAYAYLVSTLFSVSPPDSFFGAFVRRQGCYTALAGIFLFMVVLRVVRSNLQIERLLFTALLAGFGVSFWAILQGMGLDPNPKATAKFSGRVWSTFGNPIFLSSFLIMILPIHFYFLGRWRQNSHLSKSKGPRPPTTRAETAFNILILIFLLGNIVALFLARSRGPLLGLAVGLLFFGLIQIARSGYPHLAGYGAAGALLILFVLCLALFGAPVAWLERLPLLDDLGRIFQTGTGLVRVHIWKGVLALLTAQPLRIITGYGPETLTLVLPRHNSPLLPHIERPDALADRAHNELLDLAAMQGVIGLAAFLWFFGAICYYIIARLGLIRSRRQGFLYAGLYILGGLAGGLLPCVFGKGPVFSGIAFGLGLIGGLLSFLLYSFFTMKKEGMAIHPRSWLLSIILASLIGHFTELQFSFDLTSTRLYFWILAAIALVAGRDPIKPAEPQPDGRAGPLFGQMVWIAFPAWLALITVIQNLLWLVKSHPVYLPVILLQFLVILLACAFFFIKTSNSSARKPPKPIRQGTLVGLLLMLPIGIYLLSYFLLESQMARWLYPLAGPSIWPVLEKNVKLLSYLTWILLFIYMASLSVTRHRPSKAMENGSSQQDQAYRDPPARATAPTGVSPDSSAPPGLEDNAAQQPFRQGVSIPNRRPRLQKAWFFPVLILLMLPGFIVPNLKILLADIHTKAAAELAAHKQWDPAVFSLQKAIRLEPRQAERHQKLGLLFYNRAQATKAPRSDIYYEEAMFLMEKASHLAPLNVHMPKSLARISLAWASRTSEEKTRYHRFSLADSLYGRALKADPNNSFLWQEWGQVATAVGKIKPAIAHFERALRLHPNDFSIHRALGWLYLRGGKPDQARIHAQTALDLTDREKDRAVILNLLNQIDHE